MRKLWQVCDKRSQARCTIIESNEGPTHFYCIGCAELHQMSDGHRHHVMPHVIGGLSERFNVLMVCASCHSMLHNGTDKDSKRIFKRLYAYMGSRYGMLFLMQFPVLRSQVKAEAQKRGFTLADYRRMNETTKDRLDYELMNQIVPGVLVCGGEPYESIFHF